MNTPVAVMRGVPVAVVAGFLSGCSASGPLYPEYSTASEPVAADTTRIVLVRPNDRYDDYAGSGAMMRVNGEDIGKLHYGGFLTTDVAAGEVTVWTSATNMRGNPVRKTCELRLLTSPGATVYVDVAPRGASMAANIAGMVIGAAAVSSPNTYGIHELGEAIIVDPAIEVITGNVAAVVLVNAEGRGKSCGGYFGLTLLTEDNARPRLDKLRLSE